MHSERSSSRQRSIICWLMSFFSDGSYKKIAYDFNMIGIVTSLHRWKVFRGKNGQLSSTCWTKMVISTQRLVLPRWCITSTSPLKTLSRVSVQPGSSCSFFFFFFFFFFCRFCQVDLVLLSFYFYIPHADRLLDIDMVFPQRTAFNEPPFRCQNEGWGEFELTVECFTTEKGGKNTIVHDLNFHAARYENTYPVTFKNPSQSLQQVLRETGPLPNDEESKGKSRKTQDSKRKKGVDVEKMAEALPRLPEDDLLQVIQMIHDNKTDETYIKNDVDAGEFSVDLYTLPDSLAKSLWDFLVCFPFLTLNDSLLAFLMCQS